MTDDRTNWFDEKTHIANWVPASNKYEHIDVSKHKFEKFKVMKIVNENPLAETNETARQASLPAPTSYKVLEAFNAATLRKGK